MAAGNNGTKDGCDTSGLRYVHDQEPGIRRLRRGKGFTYVDAGGKQVSPRMRERIEKLVIPPAWTDVWICPFAQGHIQAVGYDVKGRKQYLYHPEWRRVQDATKFDRMIPFALALPTLRAHVRADLVLPGLPRDKAVAAVVRAMDRTFTRVGSEVYARTNKSYGIATLEEEHLVSVRGRKMHFRFEAKGGKVQEFDLEDPRVAEVIRRSHELPGQRLFEYCDEDGQPRDVESGDVNAYLKTVMGRDFSSKDFRTWAGTTVMAATLDEAGPRDDAKGRDEVVRDAVKEVAERLGNTVAVCKASYIHPVVPAAYLDGSFERRTRDVPQVEGLWPEERLTLALLRSYDGST